VANFSGKAADCRKTCYQQVISAARLARTVQSKCIVATALVESKKWSAVKLQFDYERVDWVSGRIVAMLG
jgi:hypothetical protein